MELQPRELGLVQSLQDCGGVIQPIHESISAIGATDDDGLLSAAGIRGEHHPLQLISGLHVQTRGLQPLGLAQAEVALISAIELIGRTFPAAAWSPGPTRFWIQG
jgi:hypothetical protein